MNLFALLIYCYFFFFFIDNGLFFFIDDNIIYHESILSFICGILILICKHLKTFK